jgi:hypothetical protein
VGWLKTNNGKGSWQFSGKKLLTIEFDKKSGVQTVKGIRDESQPDLVYVFVRLRREPGSTDRFFVRTKRDFLVRRMERYAAYPYGPDTRSIRIAASLPGPSAEPTPIDPTSLRRRSPDAHAPLALANPRRRHKQLAHPFRPVRCSERRGAMLRFYHRAAA